MNALVKNTQMKVIARTSSFQFKGKNQDIREIGEILDVTHILEGSVRKVGNQIRVTAQLNKTDDGSHVWSDQYDRELTDVFKVQDDITQHIVRALNTEFLGSGDSLRERVTWKPTMRYCWGTFILSVLSGQAIPFYEKAIDLDQNYAQLRMDQLAFAHLNKNMGFGLKDPVGVKIIAVFRELIEKCLSLDPDNLDGRGGMAVLSADVDHDYQSAINEYANLVSKISGICGSSLTAMEYSLGHS